MKTAHIRVLLWASGTSLLAGLSIGYQARQTIAEQRCEDSFYVKQIEAMLYHSRKQVMTLSLLSQKKDPPRKRATLPKGIVATR